MPGPSARPGRRNAGEWRKLPAAGRQGPPPPWPLSTPDVPTELLWGELWSSPQAVVWGELGWTRVVARYAKLVIEAEAGDAPVALLAEVRQMEDRLGLTPLAMRKNYWAIDDRPTLGVVEVGDADNVHQLYS
jgi:hypothetical protein